MYIISRSTSGKKSEVRPVLRKDVHLPVGQKFTSVTSEVQKWFGYENHTNKKHDMTLTNVYEAVHDHI